MAEPLTAAQGAQDADIATAPQETPVDKPTTTAKQSDVKGLADFLDIPKEVQSQLKPRSVQPMEGDIPPDHRPATEAGPAQEEEGELPLEERPQEVPVPEEEAEEADEQEPTAAEAEHPEKADKRLKRINRLTRQRNEALDRVDELQRKVAAYEGTAAEPSQDGGTAAPVPGASPWLRYITDERQLRTEVAKAESLIDWCDANPEGTGLSDQAVDPQYLLKYNKGELTQEEAAQKTVAKWRREADKIVRGAPERREELREYGAVRNQTETLARQAWPEMFDKRTEEYQLAQNLLRQFPFLTSLPQANYAVGLLIEGAKTLQGKLDRAQGKNGTQTPRHRDISERVFEPRVPLAPHTAEPLSREVKPSSHKRLNEAMSNLVKDVDGSSSSLAAAFAALDATRNTRAGSRTPVKS
jgi:hypothetical protein